MNPDIVVLKSIKWNNQISWSSEPIISSTTNLPIYQNARVYLTNHLYTGFVLNQWLYPSYLKGRSSGNQILSKAQKPFLLLSCFSRVPGHSCKLRDSGLPGCKGYWPLSLLLCGGWWGDECCWEGIWIGLGCGRKQWEMSVLIVQLWGTPWNDFILLQVALSQVLPNRILSGCDVPSCSQQAVLINPTGLWKRVQTFVWWLCLVLFYWQV